jgi:D-aspartate ligase
MDRPLACVLGDLSLVRALGRAGIAVALAGDPDDYTALSRFVKTRVTLPPIAEDPDGAAAVLCAWASSQRSQPVLYYQGDDELLLVSRERRRLSRFFRMVLPDEELVEDTVDKIRFARLAKRLSLPVPATLVIEQGALCREELTAWDRFPAVLKPGSRVGWFASKLSAEQTQRGQKAFLVQSREEVLRLYDALNEHEGGIVLQQCIPGGEENVVSYHAYVRHDGEIAAEFTGRKVRTAPRSFGLSSCVEITDDEEVRRLGRRVLDTLGAAYTSGSIPRASQSQGAALVGGARANHAPAHFTGVVKLDFKQDPRDGRLFLLEVNPRFNLWHHPAAAAGANIPAMVYRDLVEPWARDLPRRARAGVRWMAARRDLRALREYSAAGELGAVRWLSQWLLVDVDEDLSLRDPVPMAWDVWSAVRRHLPEPRWRLRGPEPRTLARGGP